MRSWLCTRSKGSDDESRADGGRERRVAPRAADVERIAADHAHRRRASIGSPAAREDRDVDRLVFDAASASHRTRREAFGPAVRAVARADERDLQGARSDAPIMRSAADRVARSTSRIRSSIAASTSPTGRCTRQSLTLPPPQPSCPHGRHAIRVVRHDAMRDLPRPPVELARRTEQRDGRRPHRGRDVHRRRVDADEQLRAADQRGEPIQRAVVVGDREPCRSGRRHRSARHRRSPPASRARARRARTTARRSRLDAAARRPARRCSRPAST